MKFALFFLGEYTAMIAGSALIVVLFSAAGILPFIPDGAGQGGLSILQNIPSWIWGLVNITAFFAKVAVLLLVFIWVRWTLPRFRYDQLMKLGWLYLFEIALVNIFLTAGILALSPNEACSPSYSLSCSCTALPTSGRKAARSKSNSNSN